MLVLSRRKDQRIVYTHCGVRFEIVVVDIRGDKVRLGIEAPPEVQINRAEVQERIDAGGSFPRVKPLLRAEREPEQPVRKRRSRFGMGGEE